MIVVIVSAIRCIWRDASMIVSIQGHYVHGILEICGWSVLVLFRTFLAVERPPDLRIVLRPLVVPPPADER